MRGLRRALLWGGVLFGAACVASAVTSTGPHITLPLGCLLVGGCGAVLVEPRR